MIDNPDSPPLERPHPVRASTPPRGLFDRALRAGKGVTHGLTMIPIYMIASLVVGTAITPGVAVYQWITRLAESSSNGVQTFAIGVGIAAAFFTYGFGILFLVPLVNLPIRHLIKPARGAFHSAVFLPWYLHNSLAYIVRYSFLDYATPTPFNHLYFKAMGMKIGKNSQINTSNISDAALITIEENVTIGGSATIIAHYGQSGYLILAPTIIRKGATIGMLSTIMADVEIGENAKILGNSLVLPKTRVPAGETWGGVPARKIDMRSLVPEKH
jgi:acetyltransferase-like isoleucine patch superfamily enzyme